MKYSPDETLGIARLPGEEEAGYETLAGFVLERLGRMPRIADHFEWNDLRFEIVDMDGKRIDRVLVTPRAALLGAEELPEQPT